MKLILKVSVLLLLVSCGAKKSRLSGNDVSADLNILLPAKTLSVDIMGVKPDPELEKLMGKFAKAMQDDPEWFMQKQKEMQANGTAGQPMPYDPKLGVTKEEYDKLTKYLIKGEGVELEKKESDSLTIIRNKDSIIFNGAGALNPLGNIVIKMDSNLIRMGGHTLKLQDSISQAEFPPYIKGKLKGYLWKFSDPANQDMSDIKSIDQIMHMRIVNYSILIGVMGDDDTRTYMEIKASEIDKGRNLLMIDMPIMFSNKVKD